MYSSFVDKLEICRVVVKKTLKISILIHWHSLMEVHVEGGGVKEGGVVAKVYFTQRGDNSNTDQITDNL